MQNHQTYRPSGQSGFPCGGYGQNGDFYTIPTNNGFAPLTPVGEWMGYSMGVEPESKQMDIDAMRYKRR